MAGSVITGSGPSKKVQVELTREQVNSLQPDQHLEYQLVVTLTNGHIVTLATVSLVIQTV